MQKKYFFVRATAVLMYIVAAIVLFVGVSFGMRLMGGSPLGALVPVGAIAVAFMIAANAQILVIFADIASNTAATAEAIKAKVQQ